MCFMTHLTTRQHNESSLNPAAKKPQKVSVLMSILNLTSYAPETTKVMKLVQLFFSLTRIEKKL